MRIKPQVVRRVVFLCPDYHYSVTLAKQFRSRGWHPTILVPYGYPESLLFLSADIEYLVPPRAWWSQIAFLRTAGSLYRLRRFLRAAHLVIQYGRFPQTRLDSLIGRLTKGRADFNVMLEGLRKRGTTVIYIPSGCRDADLRKNFEALDSGRVCANCGFADRCRDDDNSKNLALVRRYSDLRVTVDMYFTTAYQAEMLRYKAIDFDRYHQDLKIPKDYLLPPTNAIRILHATKLGRARSQGGKNIKGSGYVQDAITELINAGYDIEYLSPDDIPSAEMRFLQAQCDIIVDQLIYGSWGSTTIESMSLGKATVCYLRPSWKAEFLRQFAHYDDIPVVSATPESITQVLRELIEDSEGRESLGQRAYEFARQHFDPKDVVNGLLERVG